MGYVDGIPEEMIGDMPWHFRPELGERPKSYLHFRYYLALPPTERNLSAVADALKIGPTWVANLSSKYQWAERASAYDLEHIPPPDPEGWFTALSSLQTMVVSDAYEDYRKIREKWLTLLDGEELTAQDFRHVVATRDTMDKIARRLGRMPLSYKATEQKPLEDPDEDEQVFLGEKGPKVITDGE